MFIQKKSAKPNTKRRIRANEEIVDETVDETVDDTGAVNVDAEASDLLFEAEDVAELIAEVTGEDVAVTADEDEVVFEVAGDEFTVTPEGDEEILEATRKPLKNKKVVKASKSVRGARPARRIRK